MNVKNNLLELEAKLTDSLAFTQKWKNIKMNSVHQSVNTIMDAINTIQIQMINMITTNS